MKRINTNKELAKLLGIKYSYLTYILYKKGTENSYVSFEIPKKNEGVRKIYAPDEELKSVQQQLLNVLSYEKFNFESSRSKTISYGFEMNKNIHENAKNHVNKLFVLNVDIENFFESFNFGRIRGYFIKNKNFLFGSEAATAIAQLTCYQGILPQGAPTSPIISNLIFAIVDNRISKLTTRYKLQYSRYADDLTFSTNNKSFQSKYIDFLNELENLLIKSGFQINHDKTRLQVFSERQQVTGLTVNKKVNVSKKYYKETRAMAHKMYKDGEFYIDGEKGTINQLQGRFNFILYINRKTNGMSNIYEKPWQTKYKDKKIITNRERDYIKFLFYKTFFAAEKPIIVTEGKTDKRYIEAALKKLHTSYPSLIDNDNFKLKFSFLNRTEHLEKYLNISPDGAGAIRNIINFYYGLKDFPNLTKNFNLRNQNPVILLVDNESNSGDPLQIIKNNLSSIKNIDDDLNNNYFSYLKKNLYIVTIPKTNINSSKVEIENLFESSLLNKDILGRSFNTNSGNNLSKNDFSNYVLKNYQYINFEHFKDLLDILSGIIKNHPSSLSDRDI